LVGDAGANRLDGGSGADRLTGRAGDDTYLVDDSGDVAIEAAGGGYDTVLASVSYALADHVEGLALTGARATKAVGNALANLIRGNDAANLIDGLGGGDRMIGGRGDDTYVVDHAGDAVDEGFGAGIDTVRSALSYNLGDNLENLVLTGLAGNGSGNALGNRITGNDRDNRLDGAGGADIMAGGRGNDSYVVDHAGDAVVELAGQGTDTVRATVSHKLALQVENLELAGSGAIAGAGNDLANRITGNAAANRIDGGAGADVMIGGAGDDTYIVDNAADLVQETTSGGGVDTVISAVAFALGAGVENLSLVGTADAAAKTTATGFDGTGNGLANHIAGNGAANVIAGLGGGDLLHGRGGNDRLEGGAGSDTLSGGRGTDLIVGGGGKDNFVFDQKLGRAHADRVADFAPGKDKIMLDDAVFGGLALGKLAAKAFAAGGVAADANDRIVHDSGTGRLFFDIDGKGGEKAVLFARVEAGLVLAHEDFLVV
jgi:Ca2+-binding RTX toxin-like protein